MSKQRITATKKRTKKQERREEERRQELSRQRRTRTTRVLIFVAAIAILAGFGIVYLVFGSHNSSSSQAAQTSAGASNASSSAFSPINGVSCDSGEHYDYHHHIHLSMYINGQAVAVPQNIGINTNSSSPCLYWLHTHDTSGIVHIESPVQRTYTLGNFFDVWSQRFAQLGYPAQLGQANGWQIYVNGQAYKGDFRSIPMEDHTLVTMAYNSPGVRPETTYNWNGL